MSSSSPTLITTVAKILNKRFPLRLADTSWDNVGTLVENPKPNGTGKIMITIDLTPAVMDQCLAENVEVIVAYHPPIFMPMKKLTTSNPKQNIILNCIANGMSIYSPHTSFDASEGGINDWLIGIVGITAETSQPIQPSSAADAAAVSGVGKAPEVIKTGYGRVGKFDGGGSKKLSELVPLLKEGLGIPSLRVALPGGSQASAGGIKAGEALDITTVAVCAGSGGSVFKGLGKNGPVDLVITGELSHHEVLALNDQGTAVILAEHTNTERGFLSQVLEPFLKEALQGQQQLLVSSVDADPLFVW